MCHLQARDSRVIYGSFSRSKKCLQLRKTAQENSLTLKYSYIQQNGHVPMCVDQLEWSCGHFTVGAASARDLFALGRFHGISHRFRQNKIPPTLILCLVVIVWVKRWLKKQQMGLLQGTLWQFQWRRGVLRIGAENGRKRTENRRKISRGLVHQCMRD